MFRKRGARTRRVKPSVDPPLTGRAAVAHSHQSKSLINMQDYFVHLRPTHSETSRVHYLDIMDAKSDNKDTLMSVLYELHSFIGYLSLIALVEGDAKIYELIQSLKYGNALQWVVPFPGDWHTLCNYQIALMKPYFDAGLKALAEACDYPPTAIKNCSQFKRTHYSKFIMEAWELGHYRTMVIKYIESRDNYTTLLSSVL